MSHPQPDPESMFAALPAAVRAAFRYQGNAFRDALRAALAEMPPAAAEAVLADLEAAGLIDSSAPDMDAALRQFMPLLQAIATVAVFSDIAVDEGGATRTEIATVVAHLAGQGWNLAPAVEKIWAGERDRYRLTAGLDANSATLVRRILDLIREMEGPPPR